MAINRTKERINKTGEIFTPPALTNEMLDVLPEECWSENKTFLDPAAGDGNILIEVVKRKLSHGHSPLRAIHTTYGVELMLDNVEVCRQRLFDLVKDRVDDKRYLPIIAKILNHNIICHDSLTFDYESLQPYV